MISGSFNQDSSGSVSKREAPPPIISEPAHRPGGSSVTEALHWYLPSDWVVSIYLALTGLAVVFWGAHLPYQWGIVLLHALLIGGVYLLVRYCSGSRSRGVRFLRLLYLPFSVTFFYEETSFLLRLWHQGWFDQQIVSMERLILGVSPTLWLQPWQGPLLNEWMMLGYFSYYPLVAITLLVLFFARRDRETAQVVWALSLAFFISYLGFIAYPVQGPRYEFAGLYEQPLVGWVLVPLVASIMKNASIHGGCMPSSHVAVAIVCLYYLLRYKRRLGWVYLPLTCTLCVATVYGRFHYLSDVVVGLAISVGALWVAGRWPVTDRMVAPKALKARTI